MKHIIAIVGLPGAGKSEVCKFFKQKNIPCIRFGEITNEALKEKHLPSTEENEKKFRESLRHELGMAAFAVKNESKIRKALKTSKIIALDGLRSWEEYIYLKEIFKNLHLLAIYASPGIRHKRLEERKVRGFSQEEAHRRDISEIKNLHMAPPIVLSDYLIKNEATLEEFYEQLEKFLNSLTL